MKYLAQNYSPQGASGRGENVGQPRSACFLRREEDSGAEAEAAATAAAERRRLQRLAVVSLRGAEGGCSNTAYTDRKTASASPRPHPPTPSLHAA